jgi:hypothetical protein
MTKHFAPPFQIYIKEHNKHVHTLPSNSTPCISMSFYTANQYFGSMPFWYGSGPQWVRARIQLRILLFFSSGTFKTPTKNNFLPRFFCLLLFEDTFTSFIKDMKVLKKSQKVFQVFFAIFTSWWRDLYLWLTVSDQGGPKTYSYRCKTLLQSILATQPDPQKVWAVQKCLSPWGYVCIEKSTVKRQPNISTDMSWRCTENRHLSHRKTGFLHFFHSPKSFRKTGLIQSFHEEYQAKVLIRSFHRRPSLTRRTVLRWNSLTQILLKTWVFFSMLF